MKSSADEAWLAREVSSLVRAASTSSSCWSWCVTKGLRMPREGSRAGLLASTAAMSSCTCRPLAAVSASKSGFRPGNGAAPPAEDADPPASGRHPTPCGACVPGGRRRTSAVLLPAGASSRAHCCSRIGSRRTPGPSSDIRSISAQRLTASCRPGTSVGGAVRPRRYFLTSGARRFL